MGHVMQNMEREARVQVLEVGRPIHRESARERCIAGVVLGKSKRENLD